MAKGTVLSDSFEQLIELGQSTAKQGAKSIAQTFSPLKLLDQLTGKISDRPASVEKEQNDRKTEAIKKSSTPIDFKKIQQSYQNQDKTKLESLRNRLFQTVKHEDEKSLQRKKNKEQQKMQKKEEESQQKKHQQLQKQQLEQSQETPRGKTRRSIFSSKKVVQRSQQEIRPASGKQ